MPFSDILIEGVWNPLYVKLGDRHATELIPPNRSAENATEKPIAHDGSGTIDGVMIRGLIARNVGACPSIIIGYDGHPVRNVVLRDWDVRCARSASAERAALPPNLDTKKYPCAWSTTGGGDMPCFNKEICINSDQDPCPSYAASRITLQEACLNSGARPLPLNVTAFTWCADAAERLLMAYASPSERSSRKVTPCSLDSCFERRNRSSAISMVVFIRATISSVSRLVKSLKVIYIIKKRNPNDLQF